MLIGGCQCVLSGFRVLLFCTICYYNVTKWLIKTSDCFLGHLKGVLMGAIELLCEKQQS